MLQHADNFSCGVVLRIYIAEAAVAAALAATST